MAMLVREGVEGAGFFRICPAANRNSDSMGRVPVIAAGFGEDKPFSIRPGDPITLEAWRELDRLVNRLSTMYIIGKGRTGDRISTCDIRTVALRRQFLAAVQRAQISSLCDRNRQRNLSWHRVDFNAGLRDNDGGSCCKVAYRFWETLNPIRWLDHGSRGDGTLGLAVRANASDGRR